VNEAGVATGAVVGRSAGGDAAAFVGNCVGLGSVANCGPASSSAHATSIRAAMTAARYADQLWRGRLISTSQEEAQVHPIAATRDRRIGDRRRKPEATATCITKRSRRRSTGCGAVRRACDRASLHQPIRRLMHLPDRIRGDLQAAASSVLRSAGTRSANRLDNGHTKLSQLLRALPRSATFRNWREQIENWIRDHAVDSRGS
jgi:hypothetical protein